MFKGVTLGVNSYSKAHDFISKHKLWTYVIAPGVMNLLLFIATLFIGWHYSDELTVYFLEMFGMSDPSEDAWGWISSILRWFFMIFFRMLFLVFYLYLYKYVVLIIMSPVLALLSEKVDRIVTHNEYPFDWKVFINNVMRGVVIAVRNLAIEFCILFALFLLSFVPILGFITPFLMLGVEFFFFGFSMIDYSNERKNMSVSQSTTFIYANKGLAIAIGGVFYALLLVPIIGLMVGPSYGVVAATLATHEASDLPITTQNT
ncbi:MAG: EI24 domain-containing protein [Flavobacteriales bacterium]|nr:EI24 domain-containing protein [Flavobacteriales bacterium]